MRRLPLYFLIDVSESMAGDPIERVQEGMATIIRDLRTDPHALETVYVSIVVFAGKARRIAPLMELPQFYAPRLPIGAGTSLGEALYLLMDDIDKNVVRASTQVKGDWKPLVFLLTDGVPTDDYSAALYEWKTRFKTRANLVAIGFGEGVDTSVLNDLTDHVYSFQDSDPAAYVQFFRWISQSVKSSSLAVSKGQDGGINLSKIGEDVLKKVDFSAIQTRRLLDDRYAVMVGKCQKTEKPYLMKYMRTQRPGDEWLSGLNIETREYRLLGSYPVDSQYFELSDGQESTVSINTEELVGFPGCPHCGNPYGFSLCGCGKLFCTGGESPSRCPWCHTEMQMDMGDGSANVNRTAG
ncbi:MAG: VWA domain-containing protein [Bacteroidetes bacterium]|nr:VWA domain-containing protein [Fibrella sp.]